MSPIQTSRCAINTLGTHVIRNLSGVRSGDWGIIRDNERSPMSFIQWRRRQWSFYIWARAHSWVDVFQRVCPLLDLYTLYLLPSVSHAYLQRPPMLWGVLSVFGRHVYNSKRRQQICRTCQGQIPFGGKETSAQRRVIHMCCVYVSWKTRERRSYFPVSYIPHNMSLIYTTLEGMCGPLIIRSSHFHLLLSTSRQPSLRQSTSAACAAWW